MEKLELDKLNPQELVRLSEGNTSDFRYNRSDIYKAAFEKYQKSGETEKLEDARKEVLIFDLSTHRSPGKRFDSMMSGSTDKGEEWKYPDLEKDFPNEAIEYYKKRASATTNAILRARYADVIWELDKDVHYARVAAEAYLDCCGIYLTNEWDRELADALDRGLSVAMAINDEGLVDTGLRAHLRFIDQMVERKRFRYLFEIVGSIWSRARRMTQKIDHQYLVTTAEHAIEHYAGNVADSFHLQRSFLQLIEESWRIRKNEEERRKTKIRIAESFVEEAEWKKDNYPSGNSVAAHFYQKAMQAYMNIGGLPHKVEELKVKIQEANQAALKTDYQTVSSEVKVPTAEVDAYIDEYRGLKTIEVFQLMSIDRNLVPSYQKSKELAIRQAKEFVLQHLAAVSVMRGRICIKQIYEEGEKLEYGAIRDFQMGYHMIARLLLDKLFLLLEEVHGDYSVSLLEHLSSSGIIDPGRVERVKRGVAAFQTNDHVAAIHILVFQVEGALRDLLGKLGLPTFSYRANEMRERMLSDIVTTLCQVEGMDTDLLKFVEIFLADPRGDNYRNDVAHGLLPIGAFTRGNAELLLLILIRLASYRLMKKEEPGRP